MVAGFTDSSFDSDRHRVEIQRFFPGARTVTVRVMPLRAIILAVSKSAQSVKAARQKSEATPCI